MNNRPVILVVDDSEVNLNILNMMLKKDNYNILLADSAETALKIIENQLPDLILLDIMMDGIDGIELCRQLKQNNNYRDIPIIFISAIEAVENKVAAFQAGGVDYITKPFNKLEVKARIKNHLELKNAKEEIQILYDQLSANLEKARLLHERFLPDKLPRIEGMSLDIYYKPAVKIGGDFYYFLQYKDKRIFYLSDVSGHGLDGALVNIFVRDMISIYLDLVSEGLMKLEAHSIIEFLAQKYRDENFPGDVFFCILIGILNVPSRSIEFSNAGFQFTPLLIDSEGVARDVEIYGPPITALTPDYYYGSSKVSLKGDEAIFITTDGLMEEIDDNNVMFAEKRIKKLLAESYCLPVKYIIKYINEQFHNHFGGDAARDDVTFLYLKNAEEKIAKYSFKCYKNQTELRKVIKKLFSLLENYEIDNDELAIAINEAVANAFEHGNENRGNSFIEIRLELKEGLFILSVRDQGSGFNWINKKCKMIDIDIEKIYESGTGCGMGLYLINKVFDYVFFSEAGNCIYMIKVNRDSVS